MKIANQSSQSNQPWRILNFPIGTNIRHIRQQHQQDNKQLPPQLLQQIKAIHTDLPIKTFKREERLR